MALTEGGIYATIFYPRVKEYAQEGIASHSQILGHAIAHEIGHFLLGPVPHARFGIMRSEWTAEDLRSITMGAFLFNPRQSALIRRAAMRRLSSIISSVKRKTHLGRSKDELFPAVHRIDWAHPEFIVGAVVPPGKHLSQPDPPDKRSEFVVHLGRIRSLALLAPQPLPNKLLE